ncbi:transporter substrate-binding domain-containing protein [Pigmentibacter sp. JX0631]|uniref:substrate-binding periplasmic protein n=1 Tax=Pigmentibacter sp. JX0631 TaxID=2976982 RepID=UPI002468D121|nr:transporter substrate-binding domain-containing protein [Pigmentibacter sp. JX0631]WGL58771.1 transporter substrate-binding domain-containing protein [Pigmentibacter sp. JX0631]
MASFINISKILIFSIIVFYMPFIYSLGNEIRICSDDNDDQPFLIANQENPTGILIDIIQKAIILSKELNIFTVKIQPMPWNRCLDMVKKGQVDAVLNISYNQERTQYIQFPEDSGEKEKQPCSSKLKFYCGGYLVITLKTFRPQYSGIVTDLPYPIRVARGYSINSELEGILKDNLEIGKSDNVNLKKMLRDKSGSVIAYTSYADRFYSVKFEDNYDLLKLIKVHKKSYTKKSYYLGFSKFSSLDEKIRKSIWKNLQTINDNKKILNSIFKKYTDL